MLKDIDRLKLYFKKDYRINKDIVLKQPTVGQIVDFGEEKYYTMARGLVAIPSDMKSVLWDKGIDYEKISDFELFTLLAMGFKKEETYLLLGDLDLSSFKRCEHPINKQLILYNPNTNVIIDELTYILISDYICKLHGFTRKVEKAGNEFTKKILINEDRQNREIAKNKPYKSQLLPLISSMVNSCEFKYNSKQVLDIGIYEFMDSVSRISEIKRFNGVLTGIYTGNIDSSKLSKNDLNWMKDLEN